MRHKEKRKGTDRKKNHKNYNNGAREGKGSMGEIE